ncbi:hypothetical protein PR048_018880, partial [Dryococelus australis]
MNQEKGATTFLLGSLLQMRLQLQMSGRPSWPVVAAATRGDNIPGFESQIFYVYFNTNSRLHHRGSKLDLRSDLRPTQKNVAPFEFTAGLEIECWCNRALWTKPECSSGNATFNITSSLKKKKLLRIQKWPKWSSGQTTRFRLRFSLAGIVPDDAAGRRVFSGLFRIPSLCIPALLRFHIISFSWVLKTSLLKSCANPNSPLLVGRAFCDVTHISHSKSSKVFACYPRLTRLGRGGREASSLYHFSSSEVGSQIMPSEFGEGTRERESEWGIGKPQRVLLNSRNIVIPCWRVDGVLNGNVYGVDDAGANYSRAVGTGISSGFGRAVSGEPSLPPHSLLTSPRDCSENVITQFRWLEWSARLDYSPAPPGFSHVGIVPDDVAGRRVCSRVSVYPILSFRFYSIITLSGSQYLDAKRNSNLFTITI